MNLKPYIEYKDSWVDWIGEIPEDWEVIKLKYFSQIFGRIGFRGYQVSDIVEEGDGAITLSPSNIENQRLTLKKKTYISWEKYEESPEIKIFNQDLLFVKTGSSIGKISLVEGLDESATINPQLIVFKNITINTKFFYYCLISPILQNQILSNVTGGTMSTLTQENIQNYVCVVPKLNEQIKIASFLDKKTSKIDLTIEKDTRLIELLKEKRTALINHVVTKGLDPTVKMKDSGVEWIGEIPETWTISILGVNVRTIVPMRDKPTSFDGDIPWIRIEDFDGKYISDSKSNQKVSNELVKEMNLKIYPKNTVLCSCSCNMGVTAIVKRPLISNQTFIGLVPNSNIYHEYLFYLMQRAQEHLNYLATGAIQQYLSKNDFQRLRIPLPEIKEQTRIANYLNYITSKIDLTIGKIQKNIELLEEYKKSIIHHVVTGKVDVREVAV